MIPHEEPQAPPLEQWNAGVPRVRVEPTDGAWTWTGPWTVSSAESRGRAVQRKEAAGAGFEATLSFEGTGVAILGGMSQEGGRADVYLDGKKAGEIDAWIPERTHDNDYWHVTGLPRGKHTVRLVTRADADERSKGRKLRVDGAVVYDVV